MTPKEKAKELVDIFENILDEIEVYNFDNSIRQPQRVEPFIQKDTKKAKQCALICVDETISPLANMKNNPDISDWETELIEMQVNYQKEVKQEIEKL